MKTHKILIKSLKRWFKDDPFTQSAAAAYYAIFSLPGLLIIIMGVAALVFDKQQVEDEVLGYISSILGAETARSINNIVSETQRNQRDIWALLAGVATLLFGATGMFVQLQRSLNRIWDVQVKVSTGWVKFLKDRAISFSVILMIGFLLLISLSLTAFITLLSEWITLKLSGAVAYSLFVINTAISIFTITALFTLIFKILPDAIVEWRSAASGGVVSAVLFIFGEYALHTYFEMAQPASSFGAAGSVILLMLWVSYSCMILLIGAEFAKTYGEERTGRKAKPTDIAKKDIQRD